MHSGLPALSKAGLELKGVPGVMKSPWPERPWGSPSTLAMC